MARSPRPRKDLNPAAYARWVIAALLVGAALRVALAISDDVITNDATAYLRSGESIWAGDGFQREGHPELHFPPAYPVLLGGAARATGDPQTAMVGITLITSIMLLIPVASIARRLGGLRAGVAAVWIAAVAPGMTDVPVTSGSGNEVVFLLFVLLALRASLVAHDQVRARRFAAAALAGLLLGLAYLTRPEGLLYLPVLLSVLLGPIVVRRAADWRPRFAGAVLLLLGVAVCVVPYATYLHDNTGKWNLTAKTNDASIEAWRAVAEHDREARDAVIYELDGAGTGFVAGRASLAALGRADPSAYADIVRVNSRELLNEVAVPVHREHRGLGWAHLPLPLSAFALWGAWRRRRRASTYLLGAMLLVPTATALLFFVQPRYLIPATAIVCIAAGLAFTELPRPAVGPARAIAAVLLVLSVAAALDGGDGFLNRREPVEQRIVGQWLQANTPSAARIMTRSMIVEYYAERLAVPVPYADQDRVLAFAAYHGVDYIVVDEYNYGELRPQLLSLLDGPAPPGTKVVYRSSYRGRDVVVLRLGQPLLADSNAPPGIGFMGDG